MTAFLLYITFSFFMPCFINFTCYFYTSLCFYELNYLRLLWKTFLQTFSCFFNEETTNDLPHDLHSTRG